MTFCRTVRARYACAPLLLGLAVLLWGTGYKLSLYSHTQSATITAKLLSEDERPPKARILAASRSLKPSLLDRISSFPAATAGVLNQTDWPSTRTLTQRTLARLLSQRRTFCSLRAPPLHS